MSNNLIYITEQQQKQYKEDGFTAFHNYFTDELIEEVNDKIDELQKTLPVGDEVFDEDGTGKIKQIQYLHKRHSIFNLMKESLEKVAIELTGYQNLKCLNMQLFQKWSEISKPTRSHQDNAYFKVTPAEAITLWIALDDIDENNGCLYYAPKTHLTPTRKHVRYHEHTTFRIRSGVPGLSLCLKEHPEECDIPMVCHSGDVFGHNCNLIHRAGKNNTIDKRRRAIGIVFIPEECKIDKRLEDYHNERLKTDIELQKVKNPPLYRQLKEQFNYLYDDN